MASSSSDKEPSTFAVQESRKRVPPVEDQAVPVKDLIPPREDRDHGFYLLLPEAGRAPQPMTKERQSSFLDAIKELNEIQQNPVINKYIEMRELKGKKRPFISQLSTYDTYEHKLYSELVAYFGLYRSDMSMGLRKIFEQVIELANNELCEIEWTDIMENPHDSKKYHTRMTLPLPVHPSERLPKYLPGTSGNIWIPQTNFNQ